MKIGLTTMLYPRVVLENSIKTITQFNVETIEVVLDLPHRLPTEFDDSLVSSIKLAVASSDIDLVTHAPFFAQDMSSYHEAIRRHSVEQVCRSIDITNKLGASLVTLHPPPSPPAMFPDELVDTLRERFTRSLRDCLLYAGNHNIRLCLENDPENPSAYENILEIVQQFPGTLGITFDVGHAYIVENLLAGRYGLHPKVEKFIALKIHELADRVANVHIHDNDGRHDLHLPPTLGQIDFAPIVQALKEINYQGPLVLEIADRREERPPNTFVAGSIRTMQNLLR